MITVRYEDEEGYSRMRNDATFVEFFDDYFQIHYEENGEKCIYTLPVKRFKGMLEKTPIPAKPVESPQPPAKQEPQPPKTRNTRRAIKK